MAVTRPQPALTIRVGLVGLSAGRFEKSQGECRPPAPRVHQPFPDRSLYRTPGRL